MRRIASKDSLPRAEVFAPRDEQESMLMYGKPGLEFEATDFLPGTIEKVEVLAWRAQSGYPLFHPNDRTSYEGCGTYKPKQDPWSVPDTDFADNDYYDLDYEIEKNIPEEFK